MAEVKNELLMRRIKSSINRLVKVKSGKKLNDLMHEEDCEKYKSSRIGGKSNGAIEKFKLDHAKEDSFQFDFAHKIKVVSSKVQEFSRRCSLLFRPKVHRRNAILKKKPVLELSRVDHIDLEIQKIDREIEEELDKSFGKEVRGESRKYENREKKEEKKEVKKLRIKRKGRSENAKSYERSRVVDRPLYLTPSMVKNSVRRLVLNRYSVKNL